MIKGSSPHRHNGRQGHPYNPDRGRSTHLGLSQGCCRGASAPWSSMTHQDENISLGNRLRVPLPGGVELLTGCRGRASWDCTKFTMGCLVEETKVEKGGGMEVVWGERSMESRGKRRENGLVTCKLLLLSTPVWPCPLPDQPSLSCLPNKRCFWVTGSLLCVHVCVRRPKWQPLRGDHGSEGPGQRACVSMVLASAANEGVHVST